MNYWADLSIQLANQRDYLDQLFKVYPLVPEVVRSLDEVKWANVEGAFNADEKDELILALLALDLFPIKDSYVAYLRRDKKSIKRNPETVNRLTGRLYEMGLKEIWRRTSEPKETNRQIGPLFRRWVEGGSIGVDILDKDDFLDSKHNAILKGTDNTLKAFATEHLGYRSSKGLDFIAKFNEKYVIGEAKFLTDFGGHQDRQLADAISLVSSADTSAVKIAILDGVLYIPNNGSMHRLLKNNSSYNIMSSLVLREFLYQL